MANKKVKSLLNSGAWSTALSDNEFRHYFERKVKEGKNKLSIINAIRNKLVGKVFTIVKRGKSYKL